LAMVRRKICRSVSKSPAGGAHDPSISLETEG
jgi:hypothetical protein